MASLAHYDVGVVGLVTSSGFVEHITRENHPERPDRIRAIFHAVRWAGLIDSSNPFAEFALDLGPQAFVSSQKLIEIIPVPADERWLHLVHPHEMIEAIRHRCRAGGGVLDQGDTPVCPNSFEIALLSLGSALTAVDAVLTGRVQRAFSAARPPGHHAEPDRPMGFCLFSNIAIAARYAQQKYGVGRIAIVDFDVHHGNGTQTALEDDPSILFVSLHQHPRTCYPGSGYSYETGTGRGEGFTLNVPLDPGGGDAAYLAALRAKVLPKLETFQPELLMLSAGFDAHRDDPLASMNVSDDGFFQITRLLVESADAHCLGRVVSVLEGGYNLAALGRGVVQHLRALQGE